MGKFSKAELEEGGASFWRRYAATGPAAVCLSNGIAGSACRLSELSLSSLPL